MILQLIALGGGLLTLPAEASLQNRDFWIEQLKNSEMQIRINAAEKLGELKYPEAIEPLGTLSQDQVPEVRFAAIQALARISNQQSLDILNQKFNAESDPYLKSEVRRSIKSIEDLMKAEQERLEKAQLQKSKKK